MTNGISRRAFVGAGAALGLAGAPAFAQGVPGTVPVRPNRLSEAKFQALAARVSNWGRWGKDDVLGALNTITPETIRRASKLIREGVTVHCGGPVPSLLPKSADTSGRLELRIDAAEEWGAVNDHVAIDMHGHLDLTHLDALSHIYYRGRHYNGRPFGGVLGDRVASDGIETAREGITGRGVLIDLAAAVGKPWLEMEDRVAPADLRRAIAATGTMLEPGDILVFSTGLHALKAARGVGPGEVVLTGGMQIECAEIVHAAQPALIMSDIGMDSVPSEVASVKIPWHVLCIVMMGVRLVDCAQLGALVATSQRLNRHSFFCTVAPVEYAGASASPVNPICIF